MMDFIWNILHDFFVYIFGEVLIGKNDGEDMSSKGCWIWIIRILIFAASVYFMIYLISRSIY